VRGRETEIDRHVQKWRERKKSVRGKECKTETRKRKKECE